MEYRVPREKSSTRPSIMHMDQVLHGKPLSSGKLTGWPRRFGLRATAEETNRFEDLTTACGEAVLEELLVPRSIPSATAR